MCLPWGHRTAKPMLTATQINKLKANVEAFAIEEGWTKQQTIAFQILSLYDRGFGIARSLELVCGEAGLAELSGIQWEAHELLEAVQKSFFG